MLSERVAPQPEVITAISLIRSVRTGEGTEEEEEEGEGEGEE